MKHGDVKKCAESKACKSMPKAGKHGDMRTKQKPGEIRETPKYRHARREKGRVKQRRAQGGCLGTGSR